MGTLQQFLSGRRRGGAIPLPPGILPESDPEAEPLIPDRTGIGRFLRGRRGQPSEDALLRAKMLAALGTSLLPEAASINEATIGVAEGALLDRGLRRDELSRRQEGVPSTPIPRPVGSSLGDLLSVQAPPSPINAGGGVGAITSPGREAPIASVVGSAPGGGTVPSPFSAPRAGKESILTLPDSSPFVKKTPPFRAAQGRFGHVLRP